MMALLVNVYLSRFQDFGIIHVEILPATLNLTLLRRGWVITVLSGKVCERRHGAYNMVDIISIIAYYMVDIISIIDLHLNAFDRRTYKSLYRAR